MPTGVNIRAKGPADRGWKSPVALALALLLAASPSQVALAQIANTVTASASSPAGPVAGTADELVTVDPANAILTVTKSGILNDDNGTPGQNAGDTISWSITVRNDGNVTINSITVSDTLGTPVCPTSSADTIATLLPGTEEICLLNYTTTQADFDNNGGGDGDIDNTATGSGTALGGVGAITDDGSAAVPITVAPGVSILKEADDDTLVDAGQVVTYTYTVTNTGNQTLTNVTVTDAHNGNGSPPVPSFSSFTVNNGDGTGNFSAAAGNIATVLYPGDIVVFTDTYTVTQEDVDLLQ